MFSRFGKGTKVDKDIRMYFELTLALQLEQPLELKDEIS